MKKNILFLFISLLCINLHFLKSQTPNPVQWKFKSEVNGKDIELTFLANIETNWHMYAMHFPEGGPIPTSFHFEKSPSYKLAGNVKEVYKPEEQLDKNFGIVVKMFSKQAVFKQKIRGLTDKAFEVKGYIEFMCCDDQQCLPPNEEEFAFTFKEKTGSVASMEESIPQEKAEGKEETVSQPNAFETMVNIPAANVENRINESVSPKKSESMWGFFIVAFLAGLLGVLTPCVYPMIPMTISFFIRSSKSRVKAVVSGLIFGVSIIVIYTSVGVIVSLTSAGADFANYISTHWISNALFFLLFLTFAASFFGLFEIVLPSGLANSVDKQADKGGYLGAFFMALALVIVSFSCTGPIVGYILAEAASGAVIKPTVGMLGFGLAFALPFTFFAVSPSLLKTLPKSGGWLNSVKVVMAFILLAFSLKFISSIDQVYHFNILSRDVFIAIWIVISFIMGFYLLGKIKFSHDSDVNNIGVVRLLFVIASFTFAVYLIPGLFGAPLKALSGILPPKSAQQFDLTAQPARLSSEGTVNSSLCEKPKYADFLYMPLSLEGYYDYEQGMTCAKQLNKPVFLEFKGHACSKCLEMEEKVWSDPAVMKRLQENYLIITLYVDDRTKLPKQEWITSAIDGKVKNTIGKKNADFQVTRFDISAQPYYVLLDTDGSQMLSPYAYDLNIDKFVKFLDEGVEEFSKKAASL